MLKQQCENMEVIIVKQEKIALKNVFYMKYKMNDTRRFEFFSKERRDPYVQKLIDFQVSDTEGYIHFDGYYYVMNEEFPKRVFFNTTVREDKPYEEKQTEYGYECKYRTLEDDFYEVEIYDRVKIVNTSSYDEVEDEDGSKMRICYFPTNEQKIHFKVINKFDSFDAFLDRTKQYFIEEQAKETIQDN